VGAHAWLRGHWTTKSRRYSTTWTARQYSHDLFGVDQDQDVAVTLVGAAGVDLPGGRLEDPKRGRPPNAIAAYTPSNAAPLGLAAPLPQSPST
jgi:hypothetical protein